LVEQQSKPNVFEKLVEKHQAELSEDDLKDFLTTRMDMVKDLYIWLLGFSLAVAAIIASIGLNLGPTNVVGLIFPILGLSLAIYTIVAVGPTFKAMGRKGPFQYHALLFEQYLVAKEKLRALKASQAKAEPVPSSPPPKG